MRDDERDDYDDDERPRRRRPRAAAPRASKTPVLLIGGVVGGLVLVVGCCGGILLLGKKRGSDDANTARGVVKWGESANFGPLRVSIKSVALAHYSGDSPSKVVHTSNSPGLVVVLLIETDDKTKEHSAKGAVDSAKLKDTLGNTIPSMGLKTEFGWTCEIHGQLKGHASYAVRSDKPLTDTLVFDKPVEAATTLTLHLDARDYGGTGELVFEIPEEKWKPAAAPRDKPR